MRRKLFSEDNIIRRKLFSNNEPTRRKLFSDETKPLPEIEGKVVKCMDCGQTYKYDGSDLHIICTRCGSDRFEFLENISNPDEITPGDLNPIDKVFSEKRRNRNRLMFVCAGPHALLSHAMAHPATARGGIASDVATRG